MKASSLSRTAVALGAALLCLQAQAAPGDTATWTFNLQATGLPSTGTIDPPVALLTGVELAGGGVQFTLDPDQTSDGYKIVDTTSFIERLTIAYSGDPLLADGAFTNVSGENVLSMTVGPPPPLDAGYKMDPAFQTLSFDWCSSPQKADCHLDATETSTWIVGGAGTTLSDFLPPVQGEANNKPSPIFGVISVTAFNNSGPGSTPSNWVAMQVPEPETYALMFAGLGVLGFLGRRRRRIE
jgi:hypothetical protein